MRGMDRVNCQDLFPWVGESKTRGYRLKVSGERFKRDLRGNFFTQKVLKLSFVLSLFSESLFRHDNIYSLSDYIMRCDFNEDSKPYCDWVQPTAGDDGDWDRTKGSAVDKPSEDHPAPWDAGNRSGYYIYLDADNFLPKQLVRLESPAVNMMGDLCVEFSYYMYGPHDDRSSLKVLVSQGPRESLLWNRTGAQSHAWLTGAVTIPGQTGGIVR
eukprot:g37017.t1